MISGEFLPLWVLCENQVVVVVVVVVVVPFNFKSWCLEYIYCYRERLLTRRVRFEERSLERSLCASSER